MSPLPRRAAVTSDLDHARAGKALLQPGQRLLRFGLLVIDARVDHVAAGGQAGEFFGLQRAYGLGALGARGRLRAFHGADRGARLRQRL